jgi:hypothetical protein
VGSIAILLAGCAVDPLEDRNPVGAENITSENPEAIKAWLWAYSEQVDSLCVYHTIDKQCWESFHLYLNPGNGVHHGGFIGGGIYPTLWFWKENAVVSLTNGILDHGDHGHIVHPTRHVAISFGNDFIVADMSATPNGERIVICGAGRSWPRDSAVVTAINYLSGDTVRYPMGRRLSYVVAGDDRIVVGDDQSRTARLISLENGSTISTIATDTLVVDAVYHAATRTAFLAGLNCIDVVDMQSGSIAETIAHTRTEGVTRMLSAPGSDYALALPDTGAGSIDFITVLNLRGRAMHRYTVTGASFVPSVSSGTATLSGDGAKAILADRANALVYGVTLADGTVEQAGSPDTGCPVACNWDGTRVWVLARNRAYQLSFARDGIVDSIAVPASTSWILATSFRDNSSLFDSNDHTF